MALEAGYDGLVRVGLGRIPFVSVYIERQGS
jgi:hypothetical protein